MDKILIMGFGVSGQAVYEYLIKKDENVVVFDDKKVKNKNVKIINNVDKLNVSDFNIIIISPGISLTHVVITQALSLGIKVMSEIEFSIRAVKKNYSKVIGITGTNGKTTLCLLLKHIFNENNIKAKVVGNIGASLISIINEVDKDTVLIFELSSFQLELLNFPFLDASLITNIMPDHLDRHPSFADYVNIKTNIIKCLKQNSVIFLSHTLFNKYSNYLISNKIHLFNIDSFTNNIRNIEKETLNNAFIICYKYMGIQKKAFLNAVKGFSDKKPTHRLEVVAKINNVYFYNDSKATNPSAVSFAVNNLDKKIILLAGGDSKNLDFYEWNLLKIKIKAIIAIGKDALKIKKQVNAINVIIKKDLKKAFDYCYNIAKDNEIVLFSPGCSSSDMFENYEQRGIAFKNLVNLKKGRSKI